MQNDNRRQSLILISCSILLIILSLFTLSLGAVWIIDRPYTTPPSTVLGPTIAPAAMREPSTGVPTATSLLDVLIAPPDRNTTVAGESSTDQATVGPSATAHVIVPTLDVPPSSTPSSVQPSIVPVQSATVAAATPTTTITAPPATALVRPTSTVVPTPVPTAITQIPATPTTVDDQTSAGSSDAEPLASLDDAFDSPTSGWPVLDNPTWSAHYVEGRYRLALNGQESGSVSTILAQENYQMSVDVAMEAAAAGITFLAAEPTTLYYLIVTEQGAFTIQRQEGANIAVNVINWQTSSALRRGSGVTNTLRVERDGNTLHFFANDQVLTNFQIPQGQFMNSNGFVITSANGRGLATFDNLRIR